MIRILPVQGVFTENCYFYIDDTTTTGFIIDPGAEVSAIWEAVRQNGWTIEKILLTHGHFDHFGAAAQLSVRTGAPIFIHPADALYLSDSYLNLSGNYGHPLTIANYEEVFDGETIRLASNPDFSLQVIHTPGHTPGSVCYYNGKDKVAFVGDTLYEHGPGLTTFPGGNRRELEQSIVKKILTLPADTLLLSGHSSPITVAEQRRRF